MAASSNLPSGRLETSFAIFRRYSPPRRIVVVGSDPIALAVVKLASELGFAPVLIRPSGPETCPIEGVAYLRGEVGEDLMKLNPDRWTAVAVLTHDLDQEHAALKAALCSKAHYIGALGSRRRIPQRNDRLLQLGFSDRDLSRVRAPIGLPIGGKSPWEIAVAVVAQIIDDQGE